MSLTLRYQLTDEDFKTEEFLDLIWFVFIEMSSHSNEVIEELVDSFSEEEIKQRKRYLDGRCVCGKIAGCLCGKVAERLYAIRRESPVRMSFFFRKEIEIVTGEGFRPHFKIASMVRVQQAA